MCRTYLPTTAAAAILPALLKAPVKVDADRPLVKQRAVDVLDCVFRVCTRIVDHKAKAAWCVLLFVEAHDDAFDIAHLGEDLGWVWWCKGCNNISSTVPYLPNLLLGGVERQVANVQRGGCAQTIVKGLLRALKPTIPVL